MFTCPINPNNYQIYLIFHIMPKKPIFCTFFKSKRFFETIKHMISNINGYRSYLTSGCEFITLCVSYFNLLHAFNVNIWWHISNVYFYWWVCMYCSLSALGNDQWSYITLANIANTLTCFHVWLNVVIENDIVNSQT